MQMRHEGTSQGFKGWWWWWGECGGEGAQMSQVLLKPNPGFVSFEGKHLRSSRVSCGSS